MDHQHPTFVISSSEAQSLAKQSNLTLPQLLPCIVHQAKPLARPPISNYPVAAAALGSSGRVFLGVNLEFPGLPLHHSVHAEQFLLTNLILNAEPKLSFLAVSSAPCGHCRQFMQEVRDARIIKLHIMSEHSKHVEKTDHMFSSLESFIPNRFGPDDLLDKEVPLLLEPHDNGLSFKTQISSNGFYEECEENCDIELKNAALEAANMAHAPYSGCPSGAALRDCEGRVYKGCYVESAAFNPSLGPVQAALVGYVAGGGEGYDRIVGAVLVEKKGTKVVQEHTAKLIVEVVSPKCEFRAFHCE